MRFDLELKIVSTLTQDGLDNAAEMLYGTSNIVPVRWDETTVTDKINLNRGSINYQNYKKCKNFDDSYFSSGVDMNTDDLKFSQNIIHNSAVIPVFNSGRYTVNRSEFFWSKNNIVKPFQYNENDDLYSCSIDPNYNPNKIIISTLSFVYPGNVKNKKSFTFVPWDQTYFEAGNTLLQTLDYVFHKSTSDYNYCLKDGVAYLSAKKISYKNKAIGVVQDSVNKIFILPEFPVSNLVIHGFAESVDYIVKTGIVVFKKSATLNIGTTITASFDVVPYISFIDETRDQTNDKIFFNTSMHPKLVNYRSGTLCLSNSFGDIDIPVDLSITSNKSTVFGSEPINITARLSTVGGVACPNKEVTLDIITDNAVFINNNDFSMTKTTFADGTITADVAAKIDNIGYYIQKEWVSGSVITLPFKLNNLSANGIYTYFITSDDPILGKKYKTIYDNEFTESYRTNDLSSYEMNGRKIAYVSLQDNNGTLVSKFIKPLAVKYFTNKNVTFRNLYCNTRISQNTIVMQSQVSGSSVSSIGSVDGAYPNGAIPNNRMDVYQFTAGDVTQIEFDKPIPMPSNVAGLWMITDASVKIQASYADSLITLESDIISVELQNIKSENSFVLNKYNTSLGASQLGVFGYLTVSEYLKNPYGLNSFSMYCIHSDCIYKKCMHQDKNIQKNFILDDGKVGCIHNHEWDADPDNSVCPAQNAYLVNPFIMHLEDITNI
jgi:hypothetical protein